MGGIRGRGGEGGRLTVGAWVTKTDEGNGSLGSGGGGGFHRRRSGQGAARLAGRGRDRRTGQDGAARDRPSVARSGPAVDHA